MRVTHYIVITISIIVVLFSSLLSDKGQIFAQEGTEQQALFTDVVAPEKTELPEGESLIRARLVTIDLELLSASAEESTGAGEPLLLNLFDDALYVARLERAVQEDRGQLLWRGTIEGFPFSVVTIAVNQTAASGTVRADNRLYKFHYVGDGIHLIQELDLSQPWREEAPIPVTLPPNPLYDHTNALLSDDGSLIDIMVVYTPATRQQFGSTAGIEAEIELAVAEANEGYVNSEIGTQLRLVHTAEVSYTASGSLGTDLSRVKNQDDGYMEQVHALRDTYKADVVSLLVEDSSDGRCGVGYLMSSLSHDFERWAFNVLRGDCLSGFYVFPHEVGHNMGSEHDPANVQNTPLHPYSYGYWAPSNAFRTIMAYNCSGGCPQIQYFSNPDVTYNGVATGNSSQDNARSINSALFTMANFRVSGDNPPPSSGTVELQVNQSADDGEEQASNGSMDLSSSDLELGEDGSTPQTVGIRFQNVAVPQGATIEAAYLEFETDETDTETTSVQIHAQASDNAPAFSEDAYDLTSRTETAASVIWNIPAWTTVSQIHQSPSLSNMVQEVVDRSGWNAYQSMVFLIDGSGERTAESYDGEAAAAPLLHIEYSSAAAPTPTPTGPTPTALPGSDSAHFAVIGDFGVDDSDEAAVATLVDDWTPDFIVTVGDNVYGSNLDFDSAVGKYYCDYLADITPDDSSPYCNGGNSSVNRFFPAFGNHDYSDGPIYGPADYLAYFDLPGNALPSSNTSGNELYYDVVQGPIHLFIINSDSISRAGGAGSDEYNEQRDWLQAQLAASTSAWQIVLFHHAAYSSSSGHGSQTWMQWPFANWGADAVITGHDHTYERINLDGIVYFVNGLGGRSPYGFDSPIPGSQVRYNDEHGAMLVDADENGITFQFINVLGEVIDSYTQGTAPPTATPTQAPTVPPGGTIEVAISQASDDVEEAASDGSMYLDSSDLELGDDSSFLGEQTVGLRFQNIAVPNNATIVSAYLEFTVDSTDSGATAVEIHGEASDNAAPFNSQDYNLTSRPLSSVSVNWTIPAWDTVGESHQSPDLSAIVQQLVDRSGWNSYQSMVFVIDGDGERTAESWDGDAAAAPRLHIEYSTSPNATPTVMATQTATATPTAMATETATTTPTVIATETATATSPPLPTSTITPSATPPPAGDAIVLALNHLSWSGNTVDVAINARNLSAPGLGGATIEVFYDETVLTLLACELDPDNLFNVRLCNPSAGSNHVSFSLLSSDGVTGDFSLANLVFEAIGQNGESSPIDIAITTFGAVDGIPIPVTEQDGSVALGMLGDVNCSGSRDVYDGLFILQYTVGQRTAHDTCPLPADTLLEPMCDVNADDSCEVLDSMVILQCTVGISNPLCPASQLDTPKAYQGGTSNRTMSASVMIGSAEIIPSQIVTIPLSANIPAADLLFATTIEVHYDPTLIDAIGCGGNEAFVTACNPDFDNDGIAPDIVRFSLVPPTGATGVLEFAHITFTGIELGDVPLTVQIERFSDQNGNELDVETINGSLTVEGIPTSLHLTSTTSQAPNSFALPLAIGLLLLLSGSLVYVNRAGRKKEYSREHAL